MSIFWAVKMTSDEDSNGSRLIKEKILAAKEELNPKEKEQNPVVHAHLAWRMVVDLFAGVIVGAAMGYGLDSLFGISPILLALFTTLGFVAGINLMIRTAKQYQREMEERTGPNQNKGR